MPKKQYPSIDRYISGFPGKVQNVLRKMRQTIRETAPEATETISYGIPTFDLNSKHLVHYAGFTNHISFFPTASGISSFRKELSPYKTSTGTVQFPLGKPVPFSLIKKIVQFRIKEVSGEK